MKIFFGMLMILLGSQALKAQVQLQECENLYAIRDTQFNEAFSCFENLMQSDLTSLEKSKALNRISYLHFYYGIHFDESQKLARMEQSLEVAKMASEQLSPWMDEVKYKALSPEERREVSNSLYFYGTALAAKAEIQGNLAVIVAWPEIQKVMKLILRLGNADVEGYGAYRTLAIANTRIPAIAGGDKKLAEQYFKLILKNTADYPANTLGWVDLLLRLDRTTEACGQLKTLVDLTTEEIVKKKPGILEVTKDLNEALSLFRQKCI